MKNDFSPLLQPGKLGDLTLSNRVVMAPLTRTRADAPLNVQCPEGFYGTSADGYTDYPPLAA